MASITKRPKEDQNFWNFTLSAFFLVILIIAMWEVFGEYHDFPRTIPVFDTILMAFAAFRVTRLVVYDKITRWFREIFVKKQEFEQDGQTWVELVPYKTGFFATISDLLGCPWCIGFWSSLIIAFIYFMYPWAWFVVFFLALAGAGSLLQLSANMIGWKAENLKQDSHEKEQQAKYAVDRTSIGK